DAHWRPRNLTANEPDAKAILPASSTVKKRIAMRQQQKNNMKTLLNIIVAVIVLGSNAANAQTAYEKQMFDRCKDSFKRLFKTDLLLTNLKEVNNATMGKFASLLTQESLANLPCGLKDVVRPNPGTI